ncbi:protein Jade-3 [Elysia marginata]|uniref:Protein Jade-3 n=1 Tax=Elysia marginata TaxID=1093978 RepID=A0AAV4I4D3_9GAST|nr:protein Jade-3 [Elysia marginata]
MPHPKQNKKGNGRGGSPEPGPSRRDKQRYISSDEEDDPFPKKGNGASCSKMSKLGKINKKVPSVTKMGGMHTPCHNKPAEDLISAMKLADTEILYESEYVVISDPWRQEWEKGVQVPVNEEEIMQVVINKLEHKKGKEDFKIPPRKLMHECSDEIFEPTKHELTGMQEMAEQIVRYDLDDQDVRWLELVNEDREEMGLQLINEWNLERMVEELENQCYTKTNALKKTEEGLGIEYDEDVACDVCRMLESEDTNEMVFCDGCDICVHQACYGIQTIPEGTWLCRICALGIKPMCLLCPKRGGAMKPTKSGTKWTHVSCALWIPEVSIGCPEKMEPITKISNIPPSRWALVCCLCKERVGACIQCSVKQCKTAFHVTCGFAHNLDMRTIVDDSDDVDGIQLKAYCPKHSKNRNASESDSPKKEEDAQEDEENDISEAEMAKKRMEKLNQLEEEFYTLIDQGEIAKKFFIPEEAVDIVAEYWKLKRKANNNKPLITPKMEEEDQMQRQQKDSLTARMKMFVHLRQDLERARNLCYMISKREKTKRQLFNTKEAVFRAQLQVLTDPELSLRDAERVRQLTRFSSIYSDHSHKSSVSAKPPRENLFTLKNLKTPKDHEEEKEKAKMGEKEKAKMGEKAFEKNPNVKKKNEGNTASGGDGSSKKKVKKDNRQPKPEDGKPVKSSVDTSDRGKTEDGQVFDSRESNGKEANHFPEDCIVDKEDTSSKSRLGKVSLKEVEEETEAGEPGDIKAMVEEPSSPSKKPVIPSDLQKKLTSILQSKTLIQKQREKSDSFSESLHIDVENSDSETASPELKAEVVPVEERMNLFDQFSTDQELAPTIKSPLKSEKKKECIVSPAASIAKEMSLQADNTPVVVQCVEEDTEEKRSRHSSHKKAKRRKHSRSSHKHKRPRRSPSLDSPNRSHLSVSPIIIKTEGDTIVSKQSNSPAEECILTTKEDADTSSSPANSDSFTSSLHSDFQSPPSFSKSNKSSKKKRSRRDHSNDSLRSSDKSSSSPNKTKRHKHQSPSATEENSKSDEIQVNEHIICLEDLPSPNKEDSEKLETKGKPHSKLRLKKQLSPVKGVVSYEVVKDEEVKIISGKGKEKKSDQYNKGEGNSTLSPNDVKIVNPVVSVKENPSPKNREEVEINQVLASSKKHEDSLEKEVISQRELEEERKSKREDGGLRKRHGKVDDSSVSKVKVEQVDSNDVENNIADSTPEPEKRRTRRHQLHQEVTPVSPIRMLDDSSDENYRPSGRSPKVSPLNKQHRPRRLRTRRQLHPDETDGDDDDDDGDDEEENCNSKNDAEGESVSEKETSKSHTTKKKIVNNPIRSNGLTRRGVKLKSPLPEKPEINKLLLDPSKLVVKSSLRKRVGERLASSLKGRSRWPTVGSNQPTLDKFIKRTNSCENVFSKPNIVRDPNAKRLSLPLARADLSPLSVNKSSSVVNSPQRETGPSAVSNTGSPIKSPSLPTNVIFGAHSSPRGSLNTYRIPRRSQNSSLSGRLKDHNSPLDDLKANSELSSTTSNNTDSVFGAADKLQRPGLRRQLSFENIGNQGDNPDSSQGLSEHNLGLSAVVNTPLTCDTSKLSEDHLDGTQSYRSPSPVSSITSVASSRLGRLQAGKGEYDDDEEENTPTKRVTRSQILDDANSPGTKLRNRELSAGSCLAQPPLPLSSFPLARASPPPLLLASGSGLAQPSLPFVTSVVLRYSVPLSPTPNTHAHHVLRCAHHWTYLGPAAILVSSPLALPRSHILLRHTHSHTRTSANKHRNIHVDKDLE